MALQYWMNYVIFFQDQAEYEFAVSVAGGNLLEMAPRQAASLFGIPFPYPSGDMSAIPKGIYFISPYTVGSEIGFPGPSGVFVDDTVTTLPLVHGQAGNPPSIWPAGPDALFTWSGNIVRNGGGAASVPVPNAMPQRRWICGREPTNGYEGGSSISTATFGRDCSRTIDGQGWAIRGNSTSNPFTRTVNEYRTSLQPRTSRERFYLRFRTNPTTNDVGIWRCHGFPSDAAGCGLKILTTGVLRAFDINAVNTETSKGDVFTPVLNEWYRFDILLKYGSGSQPGIIQIYIDGVFVFGYSDSTLGGMSGNTRHVRSELGKWTSASDLQCEVDIDDWICTDLPANVDPATLLFIDNNYPLDWILGSHVRMHWNISATQVNWSPANMALGVLNQQPTAQSRLGTSVVTSSTSGATVEGLSDALPQNVPDSLASVMGAVASLIWLRDINAGGTDGTLGYRKAGGAPVVTSINQLNTEGVQFATYNIETLISQILPDEISPWSHTHVKSADANLDTTANMQSIVEYIGTWGPEDDPLFDYPISRLGFLHNCLYANTAWGYLGSQPQAPVYAIGGTYVGNGTYQEFTLPTACHFLWIRATSGTSQGIKYFGAGVGPHLGGLERLVPNVRMWFDFLAGQFKFSVVGGVGSECNVSGTTYQYIAFCDPGMRFNLCGAFYHGETSITKANPLIASGFTPLLGLFQREVDSSGSNIEGLYGRGPGHTGNQATGMQGGSLNASFANFAAGNINTLGLAHGNSSYNYSLWRTADSGGACAGVMVQIGQYTGNGAGSQVVNLAPVSGRFPLFVMVIPVAAAASFYRDPSHTGSNSINVGTGSNSTTAITAVALDQITVSSALNANGTVYNYFAICGDTAGMNNGTFVGDFCDGTGPYIPPNAPQGDINILGNGGLSFDGTSPLTMLKNISGIYTLVPGQRHDTLYDRQTGQTSVDTKIPDPTFKTGYIGG